MKKEEFLFNSDSWLVRFGRGLLRRRLWLHIGRVLQLVVDQPVQRHDRAH